MFSVLRSLLFFIPWTQRMSAYTPSTLEASRRVWESGAMGIERWMPTYALHTLVTINTRYLHSGINYAGEYGSS
jgi:hypothetical protein